MPRCCMKSVARLLKKHAVDVYWELRGPRLCLPAVPLYPKSILFVCKGNICRSPFAEHLARRLQGEGYAGDIKFQSAGLYVPKSVPSPSTAIEMARPFGVALDRHHAQPLSEQLVAGSDMVIAMEGWQFLALRESFPKSYGKIFLLPQLAPERYTGLAAFNIQDPYGGSSRDFQDCFERISRCLTTLFRSLR